MHKHLKWGNRQHGWSYKYHLLSLLKSKERKKLFSFSENQLELKIILYRPVDENNLMHIYTEKPG